MKSDTYYTFIDVLAKVIGIAICVGLFLGIIAIVNRCTTPTVHTVVEPENGGIIEKDSSILTAVPNDGYEFDRWGGDIDCSLSNIYLRKEKDKSTYNVTAYFKRIDDPLICQAGKKNLVIRTIVLDIKQAYSNTPDGFSLPFHDDIKVWLKALGITVVDSGKAHDAVMSLDIQGKALGDYYYLGNLRDYYYTGASVSGYVNIKVNGKPIYQQQIKMSSAPPDRFTKVVGTDLYDTPTDAFNQLAVYTDIWKFMNTVWGPTIYIKTCNSGGYLTSLGNKIVPLLINALSDPDINVRRYSIGILKELGPKAKVAVPALTKVLKDDDYRYSRGFDVFNSKTNKTETVDADVYIHNLAQDALTAITGKSIKANP